MKKILSIVLCLSFVLSVAVISSSALPNIHVIVGDVDLDQSISVLDATCIQKSLVGIEELSYLQEVAADVDNDRSCTIIDATWIQKYIASIRSKQTSINEWIYYGNFSASMTSSAEDWFVSKGETVTYQVTADAPELFMPLTYEFYVNDVLVQERSENATFEYTFDVLGEHVVKVKVYNRSDWYDERTKSLEVVETEETTATESEA